MDVTDAPPSRLLIAAIGAATLLLSWPAWGSERHEHHLGSPRENYSGVSLHDPWLPDFCDLESSSTPVVESRADGAWATPATWDRGRVPSENSTVLIRHAVVLAGAAETGTVCVARGGALRFDP